MHIKNRLIFIGISFAAVFAIGILGYRFLEGWSFFDSAYMTVIILSTVGYMEVHPLSPIGRIFTMAFVLIGMGVVVYAVTTFAAFVIEADLVDFFRRRRMNKTIGHLTGHYIICGLGNTGWYVVEEMSKTKNRFVVIDSDPTRFRNLPWQELLFVEGDATKYSVLENAGVKGAKGLITLLSDDKDNLYVVLTAKELNPQIKIVSKGEDEESRQRFLKAGADSVVFPHLIGGMRIASEMLRPTLVTFFDSIFKEQGRTLHVEETEIGKGSHLAGLTLSEAKLPQETGLLVLAIRDQRNGYRFNPNSATKLSEGDTLVVCGEEEQVNLLRTICSNSSAKQAV